RSRSDRRAARGRCGASAREHARGGTGRRSWHRGHLLACTMVTKALVLSWVRLTTLHAAIASRSIDSHMLCMTRVNADTSLGLYHRIRLSLTPPALVIRTKP